MGELLSQPEKTIRSCHDERNKVYLMLFYLLGQIQGWKRKMEDSYLISCEIWQEQSFDLFGVFDGHGENEVAEFVQLLFTQELCDNKSLKDKKYKEVLTEAIFGMNELLKSEKGRIELLEIDNMQNAKKEEDQHQTEEQKEFNIFKSILIQEQ